MLLTMRLALFEAARDEASPGYQSGRATTTAAMLVAGIVLASLAFVTLFADDVRRLFGAPADVYSHVPPEPPLPSDGGTRAGGFTNSGY
jgi:hypothetical protein